MKDTSKKKIKLTVLEMAIFSMLGATMYVSKIAMEFLPNVHILGAFIVAETYVYRWKALYPIYIFIFLTGLFNGFGLWWLPYLYIWAILWGAAMFIPRNMSTKKTMIICMVVSSLHGFLFGTLYAPAQALMFHLNMKSMIAWIIAGLPYDAIHGVGNLVAGILIIPLIKVFKQSEKMIRTY